jgi:hypothetical protein
MPSPNQVTWSDLTHVSHEKAWSVLQRMDREALLVVLSRALHCLAANQLETVLHDYAWPHEVGAVEEPQARSLVETVREFTDAALRGEYYQDFLVNSQNFTNKSRKTQDFGARLEGLLDRCIAEAAHSEPTQVCAAYELLFDLLREIDKFEKDIVFFADEGGVWQFGIQWKRVLPGYFRCLRLAFGPEEAARRAETFIEEILDACDRGGAREMLRQAARATP